MVEQRLWGVTETGDMFHRQDDKEDCGLSLCGRQLVYWPDRC